MNSEIDEDQKSGEFIPILINLDSVAGMMPMKRGENVGREEDRDLFMHYTVDGFLRPFGYQEHIHRNLMLRLYPVSVSMNPFKDMSAFAQCDLDALNLEMSCCFRTLLTAIIGRDYRLIYELVCSDIGYELLLFIPADIVEDGIRSSVKSVKHHRIEDMIEQFKKLRKARERNQKIKYLNGVEDLNNFVSQTPLLDEAFAKAGKSRKKKSVAA